MTGQAVFGRYIILNLTPIFDWQVTTTRKQQKFDIDNSWVNTSQFRYDYSVGGLLYVDNTDS